jgi:hypothetical protein
MLLGAIIRISRQDSTINTEPNTEFLDLIVPYPENFLFKAKGIG